MIIFGCKHRILQAIPYQNSGMWMQVSSLPTNSSLENTPRYQFSLKSETIDKMATIANLRLISIRNIKIYLDLFQIGGFLFFGGHFGFKMAAIANQNGRHMVQHVLPPVNIHFHWNLFIFEFLTICLIFILALAAILKWWPFWNGGHFEMVAILKWWPFWKFQDLNAPLEMGIHLPVKFSKDRIISLWEFDRTKSKRE